MFFASKKRKFEKAIDSIIRYDMVKIIPMLDPGMYVDLNFGINGIIMYLERESENRYNIFIYQKNRLIPELTLLNLSKSKLNMAMKYFDFALDCDHFGLEFLSQYIDKYPYNRRTTTSFDGIKKKIFVEYNDHDLILTLKEYDNTISIYQKYVSYENIYLLLFLFYYRKYMLECNVNHILSNELIFKNMLDEIFLN